MTREELVEQIRKKQSFLCVGLDSDMSRIPSHILEMQDPVFEFNKRIIDATKDYAVAYKPNLAFYECLGSKGWESLQKTMEYIPEDIFTIADAKRGDIGNTSKKYAEAFFNDLNFDAITVSPYMGEDAILPYLDYPGKWVIVLAATSNKGALDFQFTGSPALYEQVLQKANSWGTNENIMFVVGATRPEVFDKVRELVPDHFLLVPGVGAQGGSLEEVVEHGGNGEVGLLVNSSRGIIFAGNNVDFDQDAMNAAKSLQQQMSNLI